MSKPVQPFKTSLPDYDVVTGKFCYPPPYAPGGFISTNELLPRPLIVGEDILITVSSGLFVITLDAVNLSNWGVNVGDSVHFVGTGIDGIYTINSITNLSVSGTITLNGPGKAVSTGYIWFDKLDQKIIGVNTFFTKNVVGQKFIAIIDAGLNPTVQVCKVSRVENDTELYVEKGFITSVYSQPFLLTEGYLRGISINCGGAGVVLGKAVAADDVLTFYQDSGLDPVYGDSGANTFKILIQK